MFRVDRVTLADTTTGLFTPDLTTLRELQLESRRTRRNGRQREGGNGLNMKLMLGAS